MLLSIVVILLILVFVPLVCKPLRVPQIVGYIIAGIAVGQYGFGWVGESETIRMLGKAGMIYLMFLSGIEIDMNDFRRSRNKSLVFGLLTFSVPCMLGVFATRMMGYDWLPSLLLGSMYGSHTLMTYPVVSRYGFGRQTIVSVVVGGTMLAIALSLLSLGVITSVSNGETGMSATLRMIMYVTLFLVMVMWLFPRIATWFIKRVDDAMSEFLLVMLLVALAAWVADLAGLEAIFGAFVAGVALNRRIPNLSPLMNRISFVGNAFFIPVFLVGVGMMIDVRVFTAGWGTLFVAAVMLVTKLGGKGLAVWLSCLLLKFDRLNGRLMFGLSAASAAGTLAVVAIGYDNGLLGVEMLNAAVLLILFSCLIASFVTEEAARKLALAENLAEGGSDAHRQVLIALSNPQNDTALVDIALLTSRQNRKNTFAALAVCNTTDEEDAARQKVLHAARYAATSDVELEMITSLAANTANGILQIDQNNDFNTLVLGLNFDNDNSFGDVATHILHSVQQQVMLYRQVQPLNTIEHLHVAVPKHAHKEVGFVQVFDAIRQLAVQTSARLTFYCNSETQKVLTNLCRQERKKLNARFIEMEDWEDSLMIAKEMSRNDMLVLLQARPATVSYNPLFESGAYLIRKFYSEHNVLVIYPEQTGTALSDSLIHDYSGTTERISIASRLYNRYLSWQRRKQRYL